MSDTEVRQDIVRNGASWLVRDLVRERGRSWEIKQELMWGFPWAPIVDWQNLPDPEDYYGDPDLVRPELNDALNFVASNTMRIIKHHGHPKTIGVGMRATGRSRDGRRRLLERAQPGCEDLQSGDADRTSAVAWPSSSSSSNGSSPNIGRWIWPASQRTWAT